MRMKDHLINKKSDNKFSIIAHRIILLVLLIILIYQFTFEKSDKYNFLYLNNINLYINLAYYLLCFFLDLYKKDTNIFSFLFQYFIFCSFYLFIIRYYSFKRSRFLFKYFFYIYWNYFKSNYI